MNIIPIANLESGLSARQKINILIDLYNKLAISDGSYVLQRIQTGYNTEFIGITDGLKKITIHPHDNGEGSLQVYDENGNSIFELRGKQGFKIHNNAYTGLALFEVIRDNGTDVDLVTYKGKEVAVILTEVEEIFTGIDGTINPLTLSNTPVGRLDIFNIIGTRLTKTVDYTISGADITWLVPFAESTTICVTYKHL